MHVIIYIIISFNKIVSRVNIQLIRDDLVVDPFYVLVGQNEEIYVVPRKIY